MPTRNHLLVVASLGAALVIAAVVGPWLSDCVGIALPAFAMVRIGRPPAQGC